MFCIPKRRGPSAEMPQLSSTIAVASPRTKRGKRSPRASPRSRKNTGNNSHAQRSSPVGRRSPVRRRPRSPSPASHCPTQSSSPPPSPPTPASAIEVQNVSSLPINRSPRSRPPVRLGSSLVAWDTVARCRETELNHLDRLICHRTGKQQVPHAENAIANHMLGYQTLKRLLLPRVSKCRGYVLESATIGSSAENENKNGEICCHLSYLSSKSFSEIIPDNSYASPKQIRIGVHRAIGRGGAGVVFLGEWPPEIYATYQSVLPSRYLALKCMFRHAVPLRDFQIGNPESLEIESHLAHKSWSHGANAIRTYGCGTVCCAIISNTDIKNFKSSSQLFHTSGGAAHSSPPSHNSSPKNAASSFLRHVVTAVPSTLFPQSVLDSTTVNLNCDNGIMVSVFDTMLMDVASLTLSTFSRVIPRQERMNFSLMQNMWVQYSEQIDRFHEGTKYVHMDIKPHNLSITMSPCGTELEFGILDFGIAKPERYALSPLLDHDRIDLPEGTQNFSSPRCDVWFPVHSIDDHFSLFISLLKVMTRERYTNAKWSLVGEISRVFQDPSPDRLASIVIRSFPWERLNADSLFIANADRVPELQLRQNDFRLVYATRVARLKVQAIVPRTPMEVTEFMLTSDGMWDKIQKCHGSSVTSAARRKLTKEFQSAEMQNFVRFWLYGAAQLRERIRSDFYGNSMDDIAGTGQICMHPTLEAVVPDLRSLY